MEKYKRNDARLKAKQVKSIHVTCPKRKKHLETGCKSTSQHAKAHVESQRTSSKHPRAYIEMTNVTMHWVEMKVLRKHLIISCESTICETMLKLPKRTWKRKEQLRTKWVTVVTYKTQSSPNCQNKQS